MTVFTPISHSKGLFVCTKAWPFFFFDSWKINTLRKDSIIYYYEVVHFNPLRSLYISNKLVGHWELHTEQKKFLLTRYSILNKCNHFSWDEMYSPLLLGCVHRCRTTSLGDSQVHHSSLHSSMSWISLSSLFTRFLYVDVKFIALLWPFFAGLTRVGGLVIM